MEECIKKRIAEGKSKEKAAELCKTMSKEYLDSKPSPSKEDTKELAPVMKGWEFDPSEILNSTRKVTGTFHVPKIDKDNELITKAAMSEAIPNFMHLPILHDFHKERVLGVVTKVWEEADAFHFSALFKATNDVDDAWAKVQKGEYDHVSIFGARLKGNTSCGLNPGQRSVPCVSEKIRLDSISACDTNARNDSTSLTMAKAFYTDEFNIIKALSSDSGLSHGIYDGGKHGRDKMKVHEADGKDVEDDEDEEKKAEGSPAVREDMEAKKKDFKERKEGTKRSQGEDFHGGKLEKGEAEDEFKRKSTRQGEAGAAFREQNKRIGIDGRENERFNARHPQFQKGEDDEDEDDKKCGCGKGSLQKAKDGLKKIYSMLKTLTQHDKEMVAKDKEVHDKMEKAGEGEDEEKAFSRAGKMVTAISSPRASEHSSATSRAEHAEHSTRKNENRFKKGGTRQGSVRFVDADEDDKKTYADHRKEESKEVEKAVGTEGNTRRFKSARPHSAKSTATGYLSKERHKEEDKVEKGTKEDAESWGKKNPEEVKEVRTAAGVSKQKREFGEVEKGPIRPKNGVKEPEEKKAASFGSDQGQPAGTNTKTHTKINRAVKDIGLENHNAEAYNNNQNRGGSVWKAGDEVEKGWERGGSFQRTRDLKVGTHAERSSTSHSKKTGEHFNSTDTRYRDAGKPSPGLHGTTASLRKGDNMTDEVIENEEIQKANLEVEMTDEQFVAEIVKAELKNIQSTDEIVKAAVATAVAAQVDEIRKGFETSIAELKAQLTKIEEQPMVKAAIIVPENGKVDMPLNYEAIAQMTKRG